MNDRVWLITSNIYFVAFNHATYDAMQFNLEEEIGHHYKANVYNEKLKKY